MKFPFALTFKLLWFNDHWIAELRKWISNFRWNAGQRAHFPSAWNGTWNGCLAENVIANNATKAHTIKICHETRAEAQKVIGIEWTESHKKYWPFSALGFFHAKIKKSFHNYLVKRCPARKCLRCVTWNDSHRMVFACRGSLLSGCEFVDWKIQFV